MALVTCPDCSQPCSEMAPACPHCGRPLAATVIEQTAKSIKKAKIIGGLIFAVGLLVALVSVNASVVLMIIGLLLYVSASFQRWWNHG